MSYLGDPLQDAMRFNTTLNQKWNSAPNWIGPDWTYYPPTSPWITPPSQPLPCSPPPPLMPIVTIPAETLPFTVVPEKKFGSPAGWLTVGHCHYCGNPIYAKVGDTSSPPKSHRTCECK